MEENIHFLSEDEISDMFGDKQAKEYTNKSEDLTENKETKNVNELTDEGQPQESGGKESKMEEDTQSTGSPNFYSSIANALKEEGIFPNLDENILSQIKDASSLKKLFETQVDSRLNEQHKRVVAALDYGVEETEIQKYENTLSYLNRITENELIKEDKEGETLRKQLIYQDLINRGFSQEKAKREIEKSLNAGTDVEDAKDALIANREFFRNAYAGAMQRAKDERETIARERQQSIANLAKSIEDNDNIIDGLSIDKSTRTKTCEKLFRPVYKDSETGEYLTELQKYEREHTNDFLKYVGLFYTLTDGFKDFSKMFRPATKQAMKKGLSELEDVLQGKVNPESGNLKVMGGNTDNYFSGDWTIDI